MILIDRCSGKRLYSDLKRYLHEDVTYPLETIKVGNQDQIVPIKDKNIIKFCKKRDIVLVTSDWRLYFNALDESVKSILIPRFVRQGYDPPTKMRTLRVLQKIESEYFRLWRIGINVLQAYFDIEDIHDDFECKKTMGKRKYLDHLW